MTGFLVEMALARCAGTSGPVDGYRASSIVLNLGNQLFFGSLTLGVLVPLVTECNAKLDSRTAWRLALLFGLFLSALEGPVLYFTLARPEMLISVLAPGLKDYALGDSRFQLSGFGIALVPLLWAGVLASYLQASEIFWVTALSQSFNNIAVVIFLLLTRDASSSLVYGNIIGIVVMLALHALRVAALPANAARSDWLRCWRLLRKAISSGIPPLVATVPTLVTSTVLLRALSVGPRGTLAECGYAGKPLLLISLLSNALASVMLPQLSQARFGERRDFEALAVRSVRVALFFGLPVACIGYALRQPLIAVLFGSRLMSTASLHRSTEYFGVFLIGAPAFSLNTAMSQICAALNDTRAAAIGALLTAIFTFATVPVFAHRLGAVGVVTVISASNWLVCLWLVAWTAGVHRVSVWRGMGTYALQVLGVSVLAGAAGSAVYATLIKQSSAWRFGNLASLFTAGMIAAVTMWCLFSAAGLREASDVSAYVRSQLARIWVGSDA